MNAALQHAEAEASAAECAAAATRLAAQSLGAAPPSLLRTLSGRIVQFCGRQHSAVLLDAPMHVPTAPAAPAAADVDPAAAATCEIRSLRQQKMAALQAQLEQLQQRTEASTAAPLLLRYVWSEEQRARVPYRVDDEAGIVAVGTGLRGEHDVFEVPAGMTIHALEHQIRSRPMFSALASAAAKQQAKASWAGQKGLCCCLPESALDALEELGCSPRKDDERWLLYALIFFFWPVFLAVGLSALLVALVVQPSYLCIWCTDPRLERKYVYRDYFGDVYNL